MTAASRIPPSPSPDNRLYAGYIVTITDDGCGFICTVDARMDGVFASSHQLFNQHYEASVGDIVLFNLIQTPRGSQAENIQWMGWEVPQERAELLFAVARLGNPRVWLASLSSLAEEECWSTDADRPYKKDILISYIQHTFIRLCEMDEALQFFSLSEHEYMAFNTGLYSRLGLGAGQLLFIYAVFIRNELNCEVQPWRLVEFIDSDSFCRKYQIHVDLKPADYGQYNLTLFNPNKPVIPGSFHILVERSSRLPEEIQGYPREHQESLLRVAIEKALMIARQNYTIAILQFFRDKKQSGELQWLIPFRWTMASESITAMPLQIRNDSYVCKTLLTLPMAYKNARLLRKPSPTEWLSLVS